MLKCSTGLCNLQFSLSTLVQSSLHVPVFEFHVGVSVELVCNTQGYQTSHPMQVQIVTFALGGRQRYLSNVMIKCRRCKKKESFDAAGRWRTGDVVE